MGDSDKQSIHEDILKPFYKRASDAEDRLSRLEAARGGGRSEEAQQKISRLESEVELGNSKLVSEQQKSQELALENAKLKYRIVHLVRALQEADQRSGDFFSSPKPVNSLHQ